MEVKKFNCAVFSNDTVEFNADGGKYIGIDMYKRGENALGVLLTRKDAIELMAFLRKYVGVMSE